MTAYTPLGLPYPDDVQQPADSPAALQALAMATDALLASMQAILNRVTPIGGIIEWFTPVAPAGWHLCNGTAHGSAELQAVIGSATTPDMRDRFPVGAGAAYGVGATGGAAAVTLSAAQSGLRDHGHGASAWTGGGGDHNHTSSYASQHLQNMDAAGSGFNALIQTADWISGGAHDHPVGVSVGNSGAADAVASHENRPPYYALTYIIRKA